MANFFRADVLVARIPQGSTFKVRPVLVIQNDQNNKRLTNVIVAMITSNTKLAEKVPTQVLVDVTAPLGASSGLVHTSAIKCENLYTIESRAVKKIGTLDSELMQQVDLALKASLDLRKHLSLCNEMHDHIATPGYPAHLSSGQSLQFPRIPPGLDRRTVWRWFGCVVRRVPRILAGRGRGTGLCLFATRA